MCNNAAQISQELSEFANVGQTLAKIGESSRISDVLLSAAVGLYKATRITARSPRGVPKLWRGSALRERERELLGELGRGESVGAVGACRCDGAVGCGPRRIRLPVLAQ